MKNAKTWWTKRRPEIEEIFETQQYGRDPGRPADESFDVTDKGTPALDGKAIRKQVTISFSKDPAWPKIHLLIYLPAQRTKPVPMFFTINFGAIQNCGGRSGHYAGRGLGSEDEYESDAATGPRVRAASMWSRCSMRDLVLPLITTATSIRII